MKRFKKKLSVLLSGILALGIYMPPSTYATDAPELSKVNGYVNNTASGISIRKSVEEIDRLEGQYRITFDIDGTKPENGENPKAEVVLVIDKSGSMEDKVDTNDDGRRDTSKMEIVKDAAKEFCETLLDTNSDTKISIVSYSKSADINIERNNNLEQIKSKISSIKADGGTNTESGITKAKEVILKADSEAKKYVVLFTDGLPTRNNFYAKNENLEQDSYYVYESGNAESNRLTSGYQTIYPYLLFKDNSGDGNPYYYDNDFKGAQRAYHDLVGGTGDIGGIGGTELYSLTKNQWGWQEVKTEKKTAPKEILSSVSNTADSSIKFYTMGLFTDSDTTYKVKDEEINNADNVELQNLEEQKEEQLQVNESNTENISEDKIQELPKEVNVLEENQQITEEQIEESQENIETTMLEELEEQQPEESKVDDGLVNTQENTSITPYATLGYKFNSWTSSSLPNLKSDAVMAKEFLYSIQNIESDFTNYTNKYYTSSSTALTNLFNSIADEISAEIVSHIAKNVILNDEVTEYFELVPGLESNNIKGKITYNPDNSITMNIGDIADVNEDRANINDPEKLPDYTVSFVVKLKDPYYFGKDVPTNVKATLDYDTPVTNNSTHYKDTFNKPIIDIEPIVGTIEVRKVVENPDIVNNIQEDTFSVLLKGINYDDESVSEDGEKEYEAEQYNFDLKHGDTKSINFIMRSSVLYEKHVDLDDKSFDYLADTKNSQYKGLNYVTIGNYTASEIVPIGYGLVSININNNNNNNNNNNVKQFTIDKDNLINSIVVTNTAETTNYFYGKESVTNVLDNKKTTVEIN